MADRTFTLSIQIEGGDVKSQAQQIKAELEQALSGSFNLEIDASAIRGISRLASTLAKNEGVFKSAGEAFSRFGDIDVAKLTEADAAMRGIVKSAGNVGKAMTAGLLGNWDKVTGALVKIQSQLTGIVRVGEKSSIAADMLEGMPDLEQALETGDKKALELSLKISNMREVAREAQRELARLGKTKFFPEGGSGAAALSELFYGFESGYMAGKVRKAVRDIDAELAPLEAAVDERAGAAMGALEQEFERLSAAKEKIGREMDELSQRRPGASYAAMLFGEDVEIAEPIPQAEWDAMYNELAAKYEALDKHLEAVRSELLSGDAADLRDQLMWRRRELEKELEGEFKFWREWSTGSVEGVADALRKTGQGAAAEAITQMASLEETKKRAEANIKRAAGGLRKSTEVELPASALGTLVDFVAGERALAEVANEANAPIKEQVRLLGMLIKRFDEAAMAAAGLSKTERVAVERMQQAAQAEIRAGSKGASLEERGALSRDVIARLASQTALVQATFEEQTKKAAEAIASPEPVQAAEKSARGILGVFMDLYDKLVGHSIIPDMVREINAWLERIDPEFFGADAIVVAADAMAEDVINEFKQIATFVPVEEISARIGELEAEIAGFNAEFEGMVLSGGAGGQRRSAMFETAAEQVRRLRGSTPEVEAKLAQGMLPVGFGLASETGFDVGAVKRQGEVIEETTDKWYQAMATDLKEKRRFTAEENVRMEEVLQGLSVAEAQFAGLVTSLYHQAAVLSEEVATSADPESAYNDLVKVGEALELVSSKYSDATAAQRGMVDAVSLAEAASSKGAESDRVAIAERIAAQKRLTAEVLSDTKSRVEAAKAEAAVAISQAKYKQTQKQEAAKRVTIRQRATSTIDVETAKAANAEQVRQNKLLTEAQKLAAELSLDWSQVEATMQETGASLATVVGEMKSFKSETAATAREQASNQRMTEALRKDAIALGVPWEDVVQAINTSGLSLKAMQGVMQRVRREISSAGRDSSGFERAVRGLEERAQGLGKAISDARNQWQGLTQLAGDVQNLGRSMQQVGTGITGSLVLSGNQFLEFTKEADIAARALGLNSEQVRQFEDGIVSMRGELALVDAGELAAGAVTWAKAVGQTANNEQEMLAILEQTIPAQKMAALGGEDLTEILEGGAAALRQFKLPAEDMTRVLAGIIKVSDSTIAEVSGLNEGLKYLGPTAEGLGVPFEDVIAALGLLSERGIQGSMAGRGLGQAMSDIVSPTKKAEEVFRDLFGEDSPFFEGGVFIGFPEMIDKWAAALAGLSDEARQEALSLVFDQNAARAMLPLIEAQIDARKYGVDQLRAFSKNISGVQDQEVKAWAAMRLVTEGINVDLTGAVETFERQWSTYEQSDQRRVDLARARWDELWLTIGGQGVRMVVPALEKIARVMDDVVSIADRHPALTKIAATVGVGMIAGGTLLNAVGTLSRSVVAVQSVVTGFQAWTAAQSGAQAQFQTAVVSSAETFQAIVTEAAAAAAATEEGGAVAETATEEAGAVAEAGIEEAGAVAEVAIEQAGAATAAATFVSSLLATIATTVGGIFAGGGIYDTLVEKGVGPWKGKANLERWASVGAYGAGKVVGAVTGNENLADDWFVAVAEALGELEPEIKPMPGRFDALSDAMGEADSSAADSVPSLFDLAGGLQTVKDAADALTGLTDEEIKAAKLYQEMLEKRADLDQALADKVRDLYLDLIGDLDDLGAKYNKDVQAEEESFHENLEEENRQHQKELERDLAEHNKKMRRMAEDHALRVADLQSDRDAIGLYEEMRSYELEKARAEEDFADKQSQDAEDFVAERMQSQAQHEQRLADLAAQYEQEKAERLAQYYEDVEREKAQHAEDVARLERDYFERINAELGYYAISKAQQDAYYAAMLADAKKWLDSKRYLWLDYLAKLPTPGSGYKPGAGYGSGSSSGSTGSGGGGSSKVMGDGGYAGFGQYWLGEKGGREFVLNSQTTRELEGSMGTLTQGGILARAGGPLVNVQNVNDFRGVSGADEARIRAMLAQSNAMLEGQITKRLMEVVNGG